MLIRKRLIVLLVVVLLASCTPSAPVSQQSEQTVSNIAEQTKTQTTEPTKTSTTEPTSTEVPTPTVTCTPTVEPPYFDEEKGIAYREINSERSDLIGYFLLHEENMLLNIYGDIDNTPSSIYDVKVNNAISNFHAELWDIDRGTYIKDVLDEEEEETVIMSYVTKTDQLIILHENNDLSVWSISTGERDHVLKEYDRIITDFIASDDGQLVALNSIENEESAYTKNIVMWDLSSEKITLETEDMYPNAPILSFFTSNNTMIVTFGDSYHYSNSISSSSWNTATGELIEEYNGYDVRTVIDNEIALATSGTGNLLLIDLNTARVAHNFQEVLPDSLTKGYFSVAEENTTSMAFGYNKKIYIYDLKGPDLIHNLQAENTNILTALAFSSDGQYLAAGYLDGTIIIWDAQNGQLINQFSGHNSTINHLSFSSNKDGILVSSSNDEIMIWYFEE